MNDIINIFFVSFSSLSCIFFVFSDVCRFVCVIHVCMYEENEINIMGRLVVEGMR